MTINYQGALGDAMLAYEAKLGAFLQTGSQISSLRAQAQAYLGSSNPDVNSTAQGIISKATALLGEFSAIQNDAMATVQAASKLQSDMTSSPAWRGLLAGNLQGVLDQLSSTGLQEAKQKFSQVTNMIQQLAAIQNRMNAQIANTAGLQKDVDGLGDFAQGKGIKPILSELVKAPQGVLGLVGSTLSQPLKYAGIALGGLAALYLIIAAPKSRNA